MELLLKKKGILLFFKSKIQTNHKILMKNKSVNNSAGVLVSF